MQPRITFCIRCRGMKVGWNKSYISHWLFCKVRFQKPLRPVATILIAAFALGLPKPAASVGAVPVAIQAEEEVVEVPTVPTIDVGLRKINAFLRLHKVSETNRERLAESIVSSARKYGLNPQLLASIMIVESRGNPFAISAQASVGIMQIHLSTWGETADRENINLLRIEDNIDFGARILNDYIHRYGVSEGIRRYNGFIPGDPAWEKSSQDYLDKVQQVYSFQQAPVLQASIIK
jgi:soluble lytic murein transglycosylase-like protein